MCKCVSVCVYVCVCMFIGVCVRRVITTLESMLSGVGGVTRLEFWTRCCMDQMVHYTPVWQSNCSLYTAYKHTCTHKHICTLRSTHTHTHTCTLVHTNAFSVTVSDRTERSAQEDWIPTIHTFARQTTLLPDERHTHTFICFLFANVTWFTTFFQHAAMMKYKSHLFKSFASFLKGDRL